MTRPALGTTRVAGRADGAAADGASPTPYEHPVLQEPVWTWEIPLYFYTGGLAGASAGLAARAEAAGNRELSRRAWAAALAGVVASPALLISDLGRPERFLNMLRVFKVTSPMSVGSWLLAGCGAATTAAAADAWIGDRTPPGRAAGVAAALLGLPLCTYTAALVANTSVPVWHEARRTLPFVFAASAAASAGAAAVAATPVRHAAPARRAAVAGAVAELAATKLMEERLGPLAETYERGPAGRLSKAAKALTAAGAIVTAAGASRSRGLAAAGAALVTAGAISSRRSIFRAGFQSAGDATQTVGPQRERIERGETPGASRRASRG